MSRLVTGIQLAIEILAGACRRKEWSRMIQGIDRGTDGDELVETAELLELRSHARHSVRASISRFFFQPVDCGVPTFRDELRQIFNFAAGNCLEPARNPAH